MDKKTPLYECHVKAGGKLVSFAGYLLPVQYETGVIKEHMAVRTAAGLFDVSHMGEVMLKGRDALENIQRLVTNDCSRMYDGQVKYSPMCNEKGGVVDDLLVYRKKEDEYLIVVNASNRSKDVAWIQQHLEGEVELQDISDDIAQLALQGPGAKEILCKLSEEAKLPIKYYSFSENVPVAGISCLVSRTGYTGEDGYEIYCSSGEGPKLWKAILEAGNYTGSPAGDPAEGENLVIPCGLGARDTLRLEAAMPLYGHEMDEEISPLETGLGFAVKLEKPDFIGKDGILSRGTPEVSRAGLHVTGRGIAREACPVYFGDELVGRTTSGTHCPFLGRPLAMALLSTTHSEAGTKVEVEVRGRRIEAEIVPLPFYKRNTK
ncbi:MAG TPA: glycine cleavage system aminomethyltransferase GcvT [Clostridiales bacterium]|nr:glycine cleavage system aminomethyltransferase GcvT [Clostridiales bacterium]